MVGLEEVPCAAEDAAAVAATALGGGAGGECAADDSGGEESGGEGAKMEQFLTLAHLCERFKGIDNDATLVCAHDPYYVEPNSIRALLFWPFCFA